MTFLPIVVRELRVRTRKRSTYWTRIGIASAGLLFCAPLLLDAFSPAGATMTGSYVFNSAVIAAFALACSACLLTAGSIANERRDGTLGLLFLTRVRAVDILLGKFGSVGLTSLCALLAFLPILMIPVLAGGVTGGEAFRKGLVLMATLFFSLAVGLFASCAWVESSKANLQAFGLMAAALIGPTLLSHIARAAQPAWVVFPHVNLVSPLAALLSATDVNYRTSIAFYWSSLGTLIGVGTILTVAAGVLLRRSIGKSGAESAQTVKAALYTKPVNEASRGRFRPEQESPIEWLVRTQRGVKGLMWTASLVAVFFNVGVSVATRFSTALRSTAMLYFVIYVPSIIGALVWGSLFAWATSRFFSEARRSGDLELLLTTPVKGAGLVSDQWRALRRMLLWPVLLMVLPALVQFLWFLLTYVNGNNLPAPYRTGSMLFVYAVAVLLSWIVLVLEVAALCWLGLWYGLTARTQATAIAWTVGWVVGAPFVLVFLFRGVLVVLFRLLVSATSGSVAVVQLVSSWPPSLAEACFYLWVISRAKRRLLAAMAGGEVGSIAERYVALTSTVRRLRHWSPGDTVESLRPPAAGTES